MSLMKDYIIAARVSEYEYTKLMVYCKDKDITVSLFIRQAISRIPD